MRRVERGGVVLCIVPQEGEEPRRTPMPHYSWTDQEATLVQTASFSSVPGGEKTNKKQKKKKAKTSAGEHFSDGPVKQSPRTCCALPRSPRGYTSRLSRGRRPLSHFTLSCKKKKVVSLAAGGEVEERHDTRSISSILLFLLLPASSPRRSHFFQHPVLEIICCCCFVLFFYIIVLFSPRCCSDETLFPDVEVASCFVQRPLCTQLSAVEIEPM